MNYEKFSRVLRYYYDGDMIAKVRMMYLFYVLQKQKCFKNFGNIIFLKLFYIMVISFVKKNYLLLYIISKYNYLE